MRPMAPTVAVLCALTLTGAAQQEPQRFEVASIKPSPQTFGGYYRPMPNRFTATGNAVFLIGMAYQLPTNRIISADEWTKRDIFDIDARIAAPRTSGDLPIMLRHLLEERFALRVHRDTRLLEVFILDFVRADRTLGPNLVRMDRTCRSATQPTGDRCVGSEAVGTYKSTGWRWQDGASVNFIERAAGRPVVDRTGLSGQFDITLEFNPEIRRTADGTPPSDALVAELEARPLLFTALKEQLGLALEPRTEPMAVLVVDSIGRPTRD